MFTQEENGTSEEESTLTNKMVHLKLSKSSAMYYLLLSHSKNISMMTFVF